MLLEANGETGAASLNRVLAAVLGADADHLDGFEPLVGSATQWYGVDKKDS